MTQAVHFTYLSADRKTRVHAMEWKPDGQVRGIVQIVHGMQEFIDRYDEFARWMCGHGFLVAGNDLLGHGRSVSADTCFGYFAPGKPDRVLLSDIRELHRQLQDRYPDVPYILLGHSLGSFLARQYLCLYGQHLDGAVISGTAWHSRTEAEAGILLCRAMARTKGWRYRSPLITRMAVGGLNKRFEPARTKYDWLTRDEGIVDAYRSDTRTQFTFTLNGYLGMFRMLKFLSSSQQLRKMPRSLPVLFVAGEMDPVGNFGMGVKKTVVEFRSLGMKNVQCRLYPHDRHEILNETDRLDVYKDILRWIMENPAKMSASAVQQRH